MSSRLSEMRARFRERLTITPVNKSSVIVTKVSTEKTENNNIDNNNNKTNPIIATQKTNTAVNSRINSRIATANKSIPQISRVNTNSSTIRSSKVTNEKIGTNPVISKVSLNASVQRSTNPTNRGSEKVSKTSAAVKSTPKTGTKMNQNNTNKLLPQKSKAITETANIPSKKQTVPVQSKPKLNCSLKSSQKFERESRSPAEGTPCRFCGRFFALSERLQKHESVCESSAHKTRNKFDSTEQRFKGQPREYLHIYEKSLQNPPRKEANKSNWRIQHEYCIAAIREARGDKNSGPSTAQIVASTQEPCTYCKRRFNSDALKRHLPICAKLYHKKMINF